MEPGFDLVAEWQDYRETANIRLQTSRWTNSSSGWRRLQLPLRGNGCDQARVASRQVRVVFFPTARRTCCPPRSRACRETCPGKRSPSSRCCTRRPSRFITSCSRLQSATQLPRPACRCTGLNILAALEKIREQPEGTGSVISSGIVYWASAWPDLLAGRVTGGIVGPAAHYGIA